MFPWKAGNISHIDIDIDIVDVVSLLSVTG
jgi:hypothetical protein